jgi:hypothetical protein
MYPAFRWSVALRAIMDISAPAISLADQTGPRLSFLFFQLHLCQLRRAGEPTPFVAGATEALRRLDLTDWSLFNADF